jgi:tetratricopeptide (TPR) repeat protein
MRDVMSDKLLDEVRAALAAEVLETRPFDGVQPAEVDDVMICNALGDLYGRADDPQRAYNFYHRAAELYRAEGYSTKAIAILRKATRLEMAPPEALWELGGLYAVEGFKAEASQQYLRYADLQRRRDDTDAVLLAYEKIVELDPQNALIRVVLAEMYSKSGFAERALEEYERALEILDPERDAQDVARVKRRIIDLERKSETEAQTGVELPAELELPTPEDAPAVEEPVSDDDGGAEIDLSETVERAAEPDIDLEAAVGAAPTEPDELSLEGLETDEESTGVEIDLDGAIREQTEAGETKAPIGETTFEDVVEDFKEAMSSLTAGDDPQGHYDLGIAYKEMGMLDDAILQLQAAARHESLRDKAASLLAECFYEKKLPELAVKELQRALRSAVDEDERLSLHYRLAVVLQELGRGAEARDNLLECYAIDINYRDVARRLENLG